MTLGFVLPVIVYTIFVLGIGVVLAFSLRQIDLDHISPLMKRGIALWGVLLCIVILAGFYVVFSFDGDWRDTPPSTLSDFQSELIY